MELKLIDDKGKSKSTMAASDSWLTVSSRFLRCRRNVAVPRTPVKGAPQQRSVPGERGF